MANFPSLLSNATLMASNQRPSIALTLPSELLIAICLAILQSINTSTQHCRLDIDDHRDANETQASIMTISQVCRIWRNIVTRCPELWCHFINPHHRSSQWTQLVFERSKPYGITFHKPPPIFMGEEHELKFFFDELAYADQLTSYSVALTMDCGIWYGEEIPIDWPQLQYLCICHFHYSEEDPIFEPIFQQEFLLPTDFPSDESTPKLERLHLHGCSLGDLSQITALSKLKELRIGGNRVWPITQWVEILQSLHHLKRLSLDNVIAEPDRVTILGIRFNEDPNLTVQLDGDPNPILSLELEEFVFRDGYRVCAQFFDRITFTASRIFQLWGHNASGTAKDFLSFISRRITPIIHDLLQTNPHFANCNLSISHDTMRCQGVPHHCNWDRVPPPKGVGEGRSFFDGTFVEVRADNYAYGEIFKEWLHPIFSNVVQIEFIDDEDRVLEEDRWLSELLRKSSHRLEAIRGITFKVWVIILRNMFPELYEFKPPCLPDISFLSELEELGWYTVHLPDDYPLYRTIFDFCRRKSEMGRPLIRFRDPPPLWEAQSDPDRVVFIKQLEALWIQVVDEFGHRGLRMLLYGE